MEPMQDESLSEQEGYDVLLVEDDEELANLIACAIRKRGLRVKVTHSNVQACHELQDQPFALVLLDWNLAGGGEYVGGDLTGACVLEEAKRRYPSVPVIVMSQVVKADVQGEAIRSGAEAFLRKPLSCDLLAQYIATASEQWNRVKGVGAVDRLEDIRPLGDIKREYVQAVVEFLDGYQSEAAERLGISRNTVAAMLR